MLEKVYSSEARFLQHLQTQKQNISAFAAEVGATPADEAAIIADMLAVTALISLANLADDWKKTITGVKGRVLSSKPEPPAGTIPAAPSLAGLTQPVEANAIGRSRERDQRFLHANPPPSQACLEALDLIGDEQEGPSPDSVDVTIEAFPAAIGYEAAVVIAGRSNLMYNILMQRDGESGWPEAKSGNTKSINLTLTPTTPGKPEQVQLRVQLMKDDAPFGQPSEPIYVTFNP